MCSEQSQEIHRLGKGSWREIQYLHRKRELMAPKEFGPMNNLSPYL